LPIWDVVLLRADEPAVDLRIVEVHVGPAPDDLPIRLPDDLPFLLHVLGEGQAGGEERLREDEGVHDAPHADASGERLCTMRAVDPEPTPLRGGEVAPAHAARPAAGRGARSVGRRRNRPIRGGEWCIFRGPCERKAKSKPSTNWCRRRAPSSTRFSPRPPRSSSVRGG